MGNLLFSPGGRIGADAFMKGAVVLIVIGIILKILPLINYQLGSTLNPLVIITLWCWIVLFVKRLHDAGRSGWITVLIVIIYIIFALILQEIVVSMYAADIQAQFQEMMVESSNLNSIIQAIFEMQPKMTEKTALPMAIGGAVLSYTFAYVVNTLLPHDPNDNKYGPV